MGGGNKQLCLHLGGYSRPVDVGKYFELVWVRGGVAETLSRVPSGWGNGGGEGRGAGGRGGRE